MDLIYGYPRTLAALPLIAWRESLNRCFGRADGREELAELNYTLEIFAASGAAANEILIRADAGLCDLGLRRESAAEQFEADASICHITARYRCLADEGGNIYQ